MDEQSLENIERQLKIIGRALAVQCLISATVHDQTLGFQARLLKSLGFEKNEIADILGSTANSINTRLNETKSWRERIKAGTNQTPAVDQTSS